MLDNLLVNWKSLEQGTIYNDLNKQLLKSKSTNKPLLYKKLESVKRISEFDILKQKDILKNMLLIDIDTNIAIENKLAMMITYADMLHHFKKLNEKTPEQIFFLAALGIEKDGYEDEYIEDLSIFLEDSLLSKIDETYPSLIDRIKLGFEIMNEIKEPIDFDNYYEILDMATKYVDKYNKVK